MITALASSSTSVDFSAIGERAFRDRLRTIVGRSGDVVHESNRFWSELRGANARESSGRTLVIGDLAHVVREWRNLDAHAWTASVRRTLPYFLVFMRTERDRRYAGLVDDLLRACDMRLVVCNDASDWTEISACVSRALSALRPESLLDIRFVPDRDQWVVQFGDGFAGVVTLDRIGLSDRRSRLILESATIGSHGNVVEVATTEGDVFEIDSASIRGLLDEGFAEGRDQVARREDRAVGETLRTAREKAGLTQTQLGKRTGLDQAVVSRLETGRNRPRIDTLRRIAQGLGLSVSELLSPSR